MSADISGVIDQLVFHFQDRLDLRGSVQPQSRWTAVIRDGPNHIRWFSRWERGVGFDEGINWVMLNFGMLEVVEGAASNSWAWLD